MLTVLNCLFTQGEQSFQRKGKGGWERRNYLEVNQLLVRRSLETESGRSILPLPLKSFPRMYCTLCSHRIWVIFLVPPNCIVRVLCSGISLFPCPRKVYVAVLSPKKLKMM